MLPTLTLSTFRRTVARGDTLIVFVAGWCLLSRQLTVRLEGMELGMPVYAVDVDLEFELQSEFMVRAVPTLMLFRDGRQVAQVVGALPESWVVEWLGRYRRKDGHRDREAIRRAGRDQPVSGLPVDLGRACAASQDRPAGETREDRRGGGRPAGIPR
jgi:thioredoxin 1